MQPTTNKGFVLFQVPAILFALLIFAASSIPAKDFPDLSIFNYDKVIHFSLYFVLSFLTFRALKFQTRFAQLAKYALWISLLFAVIYGASDEFHQMFVPGRTPDPFDWLADSLGAGSCAIFIVVRSKLLPKNEERS